MRSAGRRDEILSHAALLFSTRGVGGTTVRDIADAVGLHSGSLYHHFGSKDELVAEILVAFLDDLMNSYSSEIRWQADGHDQLDDLVHVSLRVAVRHPHASEIHTREFANLSSQPGFAQIDARTREVEDVWARIIDRGVADGGFRADLPPERLRQLLREIVWTAARRHRDTVDTDHAVTARILVALLVDGITARPGASPVPAPAPTGGGPVAAVELEHLRVEILALRGEVDELRRASV
ncbi:TetR/AcrR family transcriptional regulator [Rhodococcus sp. ACT016]|uniref:TetR/AcrR family transcriptional regulator n=1 Tax=Rhodococcus sp. ACT016 TaxID=3134808 RepID=UPI003D26D38E